MEYTPYFYLCADDCSGSMLVGSDEEENTNDKKIFEREITTPEANDNYETINLLVVKKLVKKKIPMVILLG